MAAKAVAIAGWSWRHLALPCALVVLVAVLAALQYRWVGQVADAERQRMQASAQARANQFAEEVDRELSSLFFTFSQVTGPPLQPGAATTPGDYATRFAREYARWAATSPHPRLVKALFLRQDADGSASVRKLAPGGEFEAAEWPPELASMESRLAAAAADKTRSLFPQFDPRIPALLFPVARLHVADIAGPPDHLRIFNLVGLAGCLVVELDRQYISREWLPALARRYFSIADGFDYNVAVLDPASRSFVYASDPGLTASALARPDVKVAMFQVRLDQIQRIVVGRSDGKTPPANRAYQFSVSTFRDRGPVTGKDAIAGAQWQLLLAHRAGSLEAAIARSRHRNLAVSFGILALLAVSIGFVVLSTRRAAHLARQQVEFVAGVSHELRTPLTVICSAAENLSDGVVADAPQVRRYGALIASEGRRLAEMVEQVMAFAGLHAGRELAERQAVSVTDLVDRALEASGAVVAQRHVHVEKSIAADLPPVAVNARAVQRSLQNLIDNAIKYGGEAPWIRITARLEPPTKAGIAIAVEDHGLGIRPEEQRRIFEPFFRGRDVASSSIHGSGLGLSLVKHIVEAHGGAVSVRSVSGRGSVFTMHFPSTCLVREEAAPQRVREPAG